MTEAIFLFASPGQWLHAMLAYIYCVSDEFFPELFLPISKRGSTLPKYIGTYTVYSFDDDSPALVFMSLTGG